MSHPPPLKDGKGDPDFYAWASGKNHEWFDTLTDWSADEMRMSFARVKENGPTKECDVLRGCTADVFWAVRVHGCRFYVACAEHASLLLEEVMTDRCPSGLFVCRECEKTFSRQAEVVRSWRI